MFKCSEDEKEFDRVFNAFREEFGKDNLKLFIPLQFVDTVNSKKYGELINFWKRKNYRIIVQNTSAVHDFTPRCL